VSMGLRYASLWMLSLLCMHLVAVEASKVHFEYFCRYIILDISKLRMK